MITILKNNIKVLVIIEVLVFEFLPLKLYSQQKDSLQKSIVDQPNWTVLIDNANQESLSMRNVSDNALERDLKRNYDNWGNKDQEPFLMNEDSIILRIFYSETIFDLLTGLDDFKGRFVEMQMFTKPLVSVQLLLDKMEEYNKTLYLVVVSNERKRKCIISLDSTEYKLFGIHSDQ